MRDEYVAAGEETRAPTVVDHMAVLKLEDVSDAGNDFFLAVGCGDQLTSGLRQLTEYFQ